MTEARLDQVLEMDLLRLLGTEAASEVPRYARGLRQRGVTHISWFEGRTKGEINKELNLCLMEPKYKVKMFEEFLKDWTDSSTAEPGHFFKRDTKYKTGLAWCNEFDKMIEAHYE